MSRKIKSYLELVRLPAIFTAQADILAAWLIIGTGLSPNLLWLLLATSCFISAGMALNDYFDYQIDCIERPQRPLPSGRIARKNALRLGLGLMASGLFFALLAGWRPFFVGVALVLVILLYDGLYKDLPVAGPFFMAACRYFNLLMGMSLAPFDNWVLIPFVTGIYIFGVTVLSQKEAVGGKAPINVGGCAAAVGCTSLWIWFLFLNQVLPNASAFFISIVFSIILSTKVLALIDENRPEDFQQVMKLLLVSIIFLDTIIASGFVPVYKAVWVLLLLIPAKLSVRLFKVT